MIEDYNLMMAFSYLFMFFCSSILGIIILLLWSVWDFGGMEAHIHQWLTNPIEQCSVCKKKKPWGECYSRVVDKGKVTVFCSRECMKHGYN